MADEKNSNSEEENEIETVRKVAIGVGVGAAVGVAAPLAVAAGLAVTGFGAGGVVHSWICGCWNSKFYRKCCCWKPVCK